MRGDVEPQPGNPEMNRGHLLEPAVLNWWRQQHHNATGITEQPWLALEDWAGATPDMTALDDGNGDACIIEAKTDGHSDHWGDPGTDEIPLDYAIQVQWQMGLAGVGLAYVPFLGPRLAFVEYMVRFDPDVYAWLLAEARAFYLSLTNGAPPPVDSSPATLAILRRLHAGITNEEIEIEPAAAAELRDAHTARAEADARYRAASSAVLATMGDARHAVTRGDRVARRQAGGRGAIALHVTQPKEDTP